MQQRIIVPAVLAALAFVSSACQPGDPAEPASGSSAGAAADGAEVAARVEGVAITTAEIDQRAKEDLFRSKAPNPAKLYELRESTLEGMLEERVLAILSEQRGTTPEALIAAEVEAMGAIDDAEAQVFFDENQANLGGVSFEDVKGQIFDFLAGRREIDAARRLREAASVEILLEPPRIEVAATGPSLGPADAQVTIVEFSDFQCPFCKRVTPTIQKIRERYPKDVRIVYRHFPLRNHARAKPAAEAALCADEQGKFWPYHDLLFDNPRKLADADFTAYAEQLGLDTAAFGKCYEEGRFTAQVDDDLSDGRAAGVTGTPAFFVNGVMVSGARPPEAFFELIDSELSRL